MHGLRQHIRRFTLVAAGLTLLVAALLCAQRFTTHAQERPLRQEPDTQRGKITRENEAPPAAPALDSQADAQAATEADCNIRLERRTYCAWLTLADRNSPVNRNVTSTVVSVRNINNDVTVTGSNNHVVTENVGGTTTQSSNNSIQKAFDSANVVQGGSGNHITAVNNFGVTQTASNGSSLMATGNVFVIQDSSRSYQFAGGASQLVTQRGSDSVNVAEASNVIQGGHNTTNYFVGTGDADTLTMQSNAHSTGYTGNRFYARMGGGDDFARLAGTILRADVDGGEGSDALLLQGYEHEWVVTTNPDGSKTYANDKRAHLVTVRNVETVIIGDFDSGGYIGGGYVEGARDPLGAMQRMAEGLGRPLNLSPRVLEADRLMRQRLAELEPELEERRRQAEAAEKSASAEPQN
jgi:hypothetical protein